MRIPNIYTESSLNSGQTIALDPAATQHVVKVLRMKKGFKLRLFNGDGYFYDSEIAEIDRRDVSVNILDSERCTTESSLNTHLAIVISRGDRMDYVIQKATELGVTEITPLSSERCEVRLDNDKDQKLLGRWKQVAISACEQCGRATLPALNNIEALDEFLEQGLAKESLGLVLHHRDTQNLNSIAPPPSSVTFLIGPEGGLSEEEIERSRSHGYQACTLGPRVLRTETAPVTALSIAQWLWGDFQ